MKLALAYSTKDQVALTEQTFPVLQGDFDVHWGDGSRTDGGRLLFKQLLRKRDTFYPDIAGGADAAIAWKLSTLLEDDANYTHIGLMENDVLLDEDWFEPTMALFEKGKADGLSVGAVSARSYADRVLIQRDGYGIMHNIGAGFIIFTREAADIVLRSFRTTWYPTNRLLFAQLSGIDTNTWIGFREWTTTDWGWEAQLARHGLASLALTPSKAQMPWEDPSISTMLNLTTEPVEKQRSETAFRTYRDNLAEIRSGQYKINAPGIIHEQNGGQLFFPHQLGYLAGGPIWQGNLELQWSQGFGPFAYRAGPGGASLSLRVSGSASFLLSGGSAGAGVTLSDTRSGFKAEPPLPPGVTGHFVNIDVPGGPVPRTIEMRMNEGAVFYGLQTADAQVLDTTFRFDWSQLPEAK